MLPIILYENEIVFLNIIPYANRLLNKYIFRLWIYIKYLMFDERSGSRVSLKNLIVNFEIIVGNTFEIQSFVFKSSEKYLNI